MVPQKQQCWGSVGVEPGKEEQTSKMLNSWDDEVVLVSNWTADPLHKRREVLILLFRTPSVDTR